MDLAEVAEHHESLALNHDAWCPHRAKSALWKAIDDAMFRTSDADVFISLLQRAGYAIVPHAEAQSVASLVARNERLEREAELSHLIRRMRAPILERQKAAREARAAEAAKRKAWKEEASKTSQDDRSRDQWFFISERNRQIYEKFLLGQTREKLAQRYCISYSFVCQIVRQFSIHDEEEKEQERRQTPQLAL
jgi:hypothetical protein